MTAFSPMPIRSVAVLGAGVMGAQIAAHFANAGLPVVLLDLTADAARDGLTRARALKPDPFFGGCGHFSQWPAEILARTMERYKYRPEAEE